MIMPNLIPSSLLIKIIVALVLLPRPMLMSFICYFLVGIILYLFTVLT